MKTSFLVLKRIAASGLLAVALVQSAHAGLVQNPSFESNYNDAFPHYGAIDSWVGGSGVNESSGPFHNSGTPIPDGARVAFNQGNANLSQDIFGLEPGKQYWLQFYYDARACCGGTVDIVVKFGDVELDRVANVKPSTDGKPYKLRSVAFTPESDSGTLTLTTIASGDATVVFDAVTIVQRDAGGVTVANPSFEASGDVFDTGLLSPGGLAGWQGEGQYGVNISGGGPFADNGTAPDQDHVAFIQGAGSLSQTIGGLIIGKPYQVQVAYNARLGNSPHLQIKAGESVLFEEDVTPVVGANPYKTKTVTFTATDLSQVFTIAQTKDGDETLLLDDVRVTGEVQVALPPLQFDPKAVEIGPGQKITVAVTVPVELLAIKAANLSFRSPNPAVAKLAGADTNGVVTLAFAKNGTNVQTFEAEGVGRGVARIEVVDAAGLTVNDDVSINVVGSLVRNASFESSAVPGGVGYGAILAWDGGSGLNTAAGPFHDNGLVPDRKQIAFIQGERSLSQQILGLKPGKPYWLQFYYNARAAGATTISLTVKFNGQEIASLPDITAAGADTPYFFKNVSFTPPASAGLLEFITIPAGDATLLLDGVTIVERDAGEIVIQNPSFEASGSPVGVGYVQPDSIAGWTVTGGGRGVNINGAGPFTDNGLSSDQDRVLFLQNSGTSISQVITGLEAGQTYTLIYEVNARNCCDPAPSSYIVSYAEEILLEETIPPVGGTNPFYARYVPFTASVGEGELRFAHTTEGDHTLLLDNIRLVKGTVSPPVNLQVTLQADGTIQIVWPEAAGYVLQSTAALPGGWANDDSPIGIDANNNNVVTVNATGVSKYFRLVK